MKKRKWMSAIVSSVLLAGIVTAVPVDALYMVTTDASVPSSYEAFDDKGTLDFETSNGYYQAYRSKYDHSRLLVYCNYQCNIMEVEVPVAAESDYNEIAEKYADLIETFDVCKQELYDDVLTITMYDTMDEDGNKIKDPSLVKSKQSAVRKMCQELITAGTVTAASYCPYLAEVRLGDYANSMTVYNIPETEIDAVTELVQQFSESATVSWYGNTGIAEHYAINNVENVDVAFDMIDAFSETYEDVRAVPLATFTVSNETNCAETIDLLSAPMIPYGDIDGDGNVSVEDAVSVLSYYARQAAGLENVKILQESDQSSDEETAYLSADVNGDGEVTVEDAVEILTYYAKQSAGLDATW